MGIQRLYELMLSNTAMGIAIVLACAAIALARWTLIGALFEEVERFWAIALWATVGCVSLSIVWITVADSWLQLVTDPYRLALQYEYQRVVFDPVSTDIRRVTIALVAVSSVLVAGLFARYVGGYALQLAGLIPAIIGWFAIFIFRQRLDMIVNTIPGDGSSSFLDVLGFLGFWVLRTGLGIVSIGITWLVITLLVAPIVTIGLDLMRVRSPRMTSDANSFFAVLERSAGAYDDSPIAARWKPIRSRP